MIPSIAPLANYFKEVWYFDNRTGWKFDTTCSENTMIYENIRNFSDTYKDVIFTDAIIELYTNPLYWYIDINLR